MNEFAKFLLGLKVRDVVPGVKESDDNVFVYTPPFDTSIKVTNQRHVDNWFFQGDLGRIGEWTTMELGVRTGCPYEVLAWDAQAPVPDREIWTYRDDTPSLERLQKWCMMIEAMHGGE